MKWITGAMYAHKHIHILEREKKHSWSRLWRKTIIKPNLLHFTWLYIYSGRSVKFALHINLSWYLLISFQLNSVYFLFFLLPSFLFGWLVSITSKLIIKRWVRHCIANFGFQQANHRRINPSLVFKLDVQYICISIFLFFMSK